MENFTPISALIGGGLIGLSAVFLMATMGRIAGISSIAAGIFKYDKEVSLNDRLWRLCFISGLIFVPFVIIIFYPGLSTVQFKVTGWPLITAGVLVGIGTQLGKGCTSGHGVCGIARLSERSIVATLVFMFAAMVTVFLAKYLGLYL